MIRTASGTALDDEAGDIPHQVGRLAKGIEVAAGLFGQQIGLRPGAVEPKQGNESSFTGVGVLLDLLADQGGIALDIEDIVGDLEGEAEVVGVITQGEVEFAMGLAQHRARLTGEGEQSAGLHLLQPGDPGNIEIQIVGLKVDHLTADHAERAGGLGQSGDQFTANLGIGMGGGMSQHFEGAGQQGIAGEESGLLIELTMTGRAAPAQIVIIHAGQIIVDQRIAMDHFDRTGDADGGAFGDMEQAGRLHHQEGAQPLAAIEAGITHGLDHAVFRTVRQRQQTIKFDIDRLAGDDEGLGEAGRNR